MNFGSGGGASYYCGNTFYYTYTYTYNTCASSSAIISSNTTYYISASYDNWKPSIPSSFEADVEGELTFEE